MRLLNFSPFFSLSLSLAEFIQFLPIWTLLEKNFSEVEIDRVALLIDLCLMKILDISVCENLDFKLFSCVVEATVFSEEVYLRILKNML